MIGATGLMESGLVSDAGEGWAGAYGLGVGTLGIGKHENATTEDLSLNVKWNATDRLSFTFDAQQTKADADYTEVWGGGTFYAECIHEARAREPGITFDVDPRTASISATRVSGGTGKCPRPPQRRIRTARTGCTPPIPSAKAPATWMRTASTANSISRANRGSSRFCLACVTPSVNRTTRKSA